MVLLWFFAGFWLCFALIELRDRVERRDQQRRRDDLFARNHARRWE